jgi:hypothetical protein
VLLVVLLGVRWVSLSSRTKKLPNYSNNPLLVCYQAISRLFGGVQNQINVRYPTQYICSARRSSRRVAIDHARHRFLLRVHAKLSSPLPEVSFNTIVLFSSAPALRSHELWRLPITTEYQFRAPYYLHSSYEGILDIVYIVQWTLLSLLAFTRPIRCVLTKSLCARPRVVS